jgi:putative ABC transport system permease protein
VEKRGGFGQTKEALGLAVDALRRNPTRSFLTVLGIVIGVATVIAIGAVINGFNANVTGQVQSLGANVVIAYRFSFATLGRIAPEVLQRKELKAEWADDLAKLPHVEAAAPSARIQNRDFGTGTSTVRRGDKRMKDTILQGNTPAVSVINNLDLNHGRFFNDIDEEHHSSVAVIGSDTAASLFPGPDEDPVGQEILLEGHVFNVIGVLNPQKLSFGNGKNPNDNIAIIPLTTMMAMHPEFKDFMLQLKATDAQYVPIVVDEVRDYLRRARRLPSNKPDDFAVFTVESFLDLWRQISSGIFLVMMAVGSVALLVGGIGVMNIMLVSVTERTREIGVRKAIGARRSNIMMQFLLEAVLLSAVGGIIGEILGSLLSLGVAYFSPLPAQVTPFWLVLGFSVSAMIGIFFGVYPAWKAASLSPVEALRYE